MSLPEGCGSCLAGTQSEIEFLACILGDQFGLISGPERSALQVPPLHPLPGPCVRPCSNSWSFGLTGGDARPDLRQSLLAGLGLGSVATFRAERDTWFMSEAPTGIDFYLFAYSRWSDFNGRSSKEEFWRFLGVHVGIAAASVTGGIVLAVPALASIYFLCLYFAISAVPWVALNVRRLHDTGRSGWVLLVSLVPLIGIIAMLVLQAQPSTPVNKWGSPSGTPAIEYACSGCDEVVPENAEFCPHCGGSFGSDKCGQCGTTARKGDSYCMKCGESLK